MTDALRFYMLDDFWRDLRYALRTLGRNRGFAAAAVLSLSLGIGANAAIFSLINAVMLRALPVRDPDRLVQITRVSPEGRPGALSYGLFEYFRDNLTTMSGAFAQAAGDQAIEIDGEEEFVTDGPRVGCVLHRARDRASGGPAARTGRRCGFPVVAGGSH